MYNRNFLRTVGFFASSIKQNNNAFTVVSCPGVKIIKISDEKANV